MKKGFTLIELLAVIVILAIIALIVVPIVINIIEDTKNNSILSSADFYLDAVDLSIVEAKLKGIKVVDGEHPIMEDGNLCIGTLRSNTCDGDILKVELEGIKPTSGTIEIVSKNIKDIKLILSDKKVIKNNKGELVLRDNVKICKLINDAAPTGISAGDKYQCKVKDDMETKFEDGYYFYVLSQELDGTTNLIMDRNINSDGTPITKAILEEDKATNGGIYNLVAWINRDGYESAGGTSWYEGEDVLTFGPVAAMNFLTNATSTWENIPNLNLTYDDEEDSFTNFKVTGKARLPYHREVNDVGCLDDEELSCPVWMVDYLYDSGPDYETIYQENPIDDAIFGYWTFSSYYEDSWGAWVIDTYGYVSPFTATSYDGYGVRPVINIKL